MLEKPILYNGFTFNDQAARNAGLGWAKLFELTGFDDADVREERVERPGQDGEESSEMFYGGRTLGMRGEIRARNLLEMRQMEDAIRSAVDNEAHELQGQRWNTPVLGIIARKNQKLDMPDVQDTASFKRPFTISLRADDPYFYDLASKSLTHDFIGLLQGVRRYDLAWKPDVGAFPTKMMKFDVAPLVGSGGGTVTPSGDWSLVAGPPGYGTAFACNSTGVVVQTFNPALGASDLIWTMGAWVYPTAYNTAPMVVCQLNHDGLDPYLAIKDTGELTARGLIGISPNNNLDGTAVVPLNEWTHVMFSWDGTNYVLWINFEIDTIIPATGPADIGFSYSFQCSVAGPSSQRFKGLIDEAFLFRNSVVLPQRRRAYPRLYVADPGSLATPDNEGTARAYPVTQLYGPVTNPSWRNLTTGEQMIWTDLIIPQGSWIEIDHKAGTIKKNGTIESYSGFDIANSEFWALAPGQNVLELFGLNTGLATRATLTWRDAYK